MLIRFALPVVFGLGAGAAAAHPAMTVEPTTMRAAPSAHARIVQKIPARAQIDLGECDDLWCAASWRDLDGFVRVEAVGPNDAPLDRPPPPPVFVGPVFGFGFYRHW